ncbi:MAG: DUF6285 domain-containing protein [Actinomycetota bacterium]|nr:DUF6285 domain-containing protein [Actinomycetota bacterium]
MTEIDRSDWALPPRTNLPYDAPSAEDLIQAVQEYLSEDLLPKSSGAEKWKLRIAVNSLSIAIRELTERDEDQATYAKIMNELGVEDEASLAEKIKAGEFDGNLPDIHKKLSEITRRKLNVSNPLYMKPESP